MNKKAIRLTEQDPHKMVMESVNRILKERIFSPDELDDRAYMEDYWKQRQQQMEDDYIHKNKKIRQMYPGKSDEWYEAMIDTI